jgi:hypothetical protein
MFRTALTQLAGLNVAGVGVNYDVDTVPDEISRGQLPALLVLPVETSATAESGLFRERGGGFEALGFSQGARTVTYSVTHLLLLAPLGAGGGLRTHLPQLIDLIDAYFGALGAAVTLHGALLEPARVRVEPGIFAYGGAEYYGCAFRHSWVVAV